MIETAAKVMTEISTASSMEGKTDTTADPASKTVGTAAKMEVCHRCGRSITRDEIGISKKLINRGTTTYYCIPCLAAAFEVEPSDIEKKIIYFKHMGCTLFC